MRKKHKRSLPLIVCGVLILTLFAGCGDAETASHMNNSSNSVKSGEKTVTVAISGKNGVATMDPTYMMTDILHYELVYDPLVIYGENGKIEPGLAESWDISDDGKEYTFHLRKDVKFSDGSDFNADNVIFNTDRWKNNPNTASINVCNSLQTVTKIDDNTVKFTFDKAYYPFLTELTYSGPCRMMSKNSVDAGGKFIKPIGTGMWMIKSSQEDKETVLVPNPNYWGEKPKFDKLVIKVIPDAQTRLMALQSGEIDFCCVPIPTESFPAIEKDSKLELASNKSTKGYHIIFNYDVPAFQNLQIRQAINYAIDKDSIVNDILDGNAGAAKGVLATTNAYVNDKNSPGYKYDPDKAKNLLTEAGCIDSDGDGILEYNGEPMSFKFVFQTDEYPEWKDVCEYISNELKAIGIEFKLELQPSTEYYDSLWTNRSFDVIMYRTYLDSWNPHGFLSGQYCKDTAGSPRVAWDSDELDAMITKVLQEMDESSRQQQYDEIFRYLYDNAVNIPIYYPNVSYAYNKEKLSNFQFAVTEYELIKWGRLEVKG